MKSIDDGFEVIDVKFKKMKEQLNALKEIKIDKELSYKLIGDLFFEQSVVSIEQLSIIKHELYESKNFKHINEDGFSAFHLYNHITESLKSSHPLKYIENHQNTHKLFESTFLHTEEPVQIITPTLEEVVEFAE